MARDGHGRSRADDLAGADRATSPSILVGRAAERAVIDQLLDGARQGVAGAVLFVGPAGIGKSTLLRYAIDAGADFRLLRVTGVESERAFGFAGVHQLLVPLLDCVDALAEPHRTTVQGVLGNVQHDGLDTYLVGLAVMNLVAEASLSQPILVIVDDAQWLDDESAMALAFAGRRLAAERVTTFLAMRETPEARRLFQNLRRVDIGGLSPQEGHDLLSAASRPLDEEVAAHLVSAVDGNPLALVELPVMLTADQLRGAAPLPDPLPIGEHLAELFAARIGSLDADARMLLLLASTEPVGDPSLLARSAEAAGVSWTRAVPELERSGLISFGPAPTFRHPLVRSAVYYSASGPDRRRAHAAMAAVLDAPTDIDRRAWHLGAAASMPDEDVARALYASAERARQRGGAAAAAIFLSRAAELTPSQERAAERLLEAARAELMGGRAAPARQLLDRASAGGLSERHRAEAAWTEALIHIVAGDILPAAALLADALPLIPAGESELAAGACVAALGIAAIGGHLVDESTRRAIGAAARDLLGRTEVPHPIAPVIESIATSMLSGQTEATAAMRAAVTAAVADQSHLHGVAGRRVNVTYFDTVLAAAAVLDDHAWADLADTWTQLARRVGSLPSLPSVLGLRSWLDVLQGRLGAATSHLAEIDDVVPHIGARGVLGSPAAAQVLRDAWRGDEHATRTGARRMMRDAHERGLGIGIDHAYSALMVLELGSGRYAAALTAAKQVLARDSMVVGTIALADVVESAVRCDDQRVADAALERLSERATAAGTQWAMGLLERSRALVARGDEADAHFRAALDHLSRCTIATDTARTQLLYGEWLRRARRRKDAREPLRAALDLFEVMSASGFAARARAELLATGQHLRSRAAPVTELTPQEAQIARLAASGARNQDIAAQLYITTSTVEYHLRKIFVKLAVTSRTQLAQVALPQ